FARQALPLEAPQERGLHLLIGAVDDDLPFLLDLDGVLLLPRLSQSASYFSRRRLDVLPEGRHRWRVGGLLQCGQHSRIVAGELAQRVDGREQGAGLLVVDVESLAVYLRVAKLLLAEMAVDEGERRWPSMRVSGASSM